MLDFTVFSGSLYGGGGGGNVPGMCLVVFFFFLIYEKDHGVIESHVIL